MRMLQTLSSIVLASFKTSTYQGGRGLLWRFGVGRVRTTTPRPKHWALTNSRPSANVRLLMRRLANLAAASLGELFQPPLLDYAVFAHFSGSLVCRLCRLCGIAAVSHSA